MTHITNRTWTAADIERLRQLVRSGASAARAAVIFRRSIVSVKAQAKRFGFPFPDERVLRRERKARDIQTGF
jgi:hypothetical protein